MKTKTFLLALFAMMAFGMNAQKTADRTYLDKAIAELQVGNCNGAHVFYTVYLGMGGDTMPAIENLISECLHANDTAKIYKVGDVIQVGNDLYTVAHVTNGGKHGFAICGMGAGALKPEYVNGRKIPSWSEWELIKANNTVLKLAGQFWTTEPTGSASCANSGTQYRVIGLGSYGGTNFSTTTDCPSYFHSLLYIYRF